MRVQCSTCLELLTPGDDLTSTPCGHVFHMHCVVQWFETKKNCPQCRHSANERNLRKIYLAETDGDDDANPDDLQNRLDNAQLQVRCITTERERLTTKLKEAESANLKLRDEVKRVEAGKRRAKELCDGYKTEVKYLQEEREANNRYKEEAQRCRAQLERFKAMEVALTGSEGDVNMMLHERGAFDERSRDLAVLIVELKKKMVEVKRQRSVFEQKLVDAHRTRDEARSKVRDLLVANSDLKTINQSLETDLQMATGENERLKTDIDRLTSERQRVGNDSREETSANSSSSLLHEADLSPRPLVIDGLSPVKSSSPAKRPTPDIPLKSCGILLPEKRKPFSQINSDVIKKRKMGSNLIENFTRIDRSDMKQYDGFGGRSRIDEFPKSHGFSRPVKKPSVSKSSSSQGSKLSQSRMKQKNTLDKFFGSFDTP